MATNPGKHPIIVLITLLVSFLSLLAVIVIARTFGVTPSQFHDPNLVLQPSVMATVLAILLVPIFVVVAVQRSVHHGSLCDLGLRRPAVSAFTTGTIFGLAVKVAALAGAYLCSPTPSLSPAVIGIDAVTWFLYFGWYVVTLLLNSFNEELVYRAYLLEGWRGVYRIPDFGLVVITATVFSVMHFLIEPPDLLHFLYRFAFGILAGLLYVKWKSLWLIVGLHTGWNFGSLSFSDSDWRMGGLVKVAGLLENSETIANVIVLAMASATIALTFRKSVDARTRSNSGISTRRQS